MNFIYYIIFIKDYQPQKFIYLKKSVYSKQLLDLTSAHKMQGLAKNSQIVMKFTSDNYCESFPVLIK